MQKKGRHIAAAKSSFLHVASKRNARVPARERDEAAFGMRGEGQPAESREQRARVREEAETPGTRRRTSFSDILFALVFLVGLGLLLYPLISNTWNEWRASQLIGDYQEQAKNTSDEETATWFAAAEAYNRTLEGKGIPDAFAFHEEDENADYLAQLAFRDDGMMGYLNIPRIEQNLPIYHTTSEKALASGVGHLQGSALPVGGESTHCVLSAHRGLPAQALFTDLDQLVPGDRFFIHVLNRTLAYEVDQTEVVEPTQTESLGITEGEDRMTLVTCTPYGVNTHRLLVHAHRVDYDPADEAETANTHSIFTQYWLWIALGLLCVALVVLFFQIIAKRRQKRQELRRSHDPRQTRQTARGRQERRERTNHRERP